MLSKNKILGIILIPALWVGCSPAPAYAYDFYGDTDDQVRVEFGGWSRHAKSVSSNVTNERHEIIGVEYKNIAVGKFDNSYGRETYFVAGVSRWKGILEIEDLNFVASLGINRGYTTCYGEDYSNKDVCLHGYLGVEYVKDFAYISAKVQPGVGLINFGVVF